MKFVYLTNSIYEQNTLVNNVTVINRQNKKIHDTEIVYGGNQYYLNKNISDKNYLNFLNNIGLLDKNLNKYVMYGGFDFGLGLGLGLNDKNNDLLSCDNLSNSLNYYNNPNKNFKNIFILDHKVVNDTLIIFFNNQLNYIEPNNISILNTCLKYLSNTNPYKYTNDMTIIDLIQLQMDDLGLILKNNINVKSIIFISQSPIFICEYQKNKINVDKSLKFLEFINRYFYLLKDLKINCVCGDFNNRNETATITIEKIDNQTNLIEQLSINQYIIGTNFNSDDEELKHNLKIINETKEFNDQCEIKMNIIDKILIFKIIYKINNINKNFGFIEFEISKKNIGNPIFNFVDSNKIIEDKKLKIEGLKNILNKQNIFEQNILDNIEISISDSDNISDNVEITEDGDPYKEKYLKYRKKLYKLRNKKIQ